MLDAITEVGIWDRVLAIYVIKITSSISPGSLNPTEACASTFLQD